MEEAAMMDDELRQKNAFLREKIKEISDRHPELRDLADEIALEQSTHVEVGTPFLERVNGKLQERARAIIEPSQVRSAAPERLGASFSLCSISSMLKSMLACRARVLKRVDEPSDLCNRSTSLVSQRHGLATRGGAGERARSSFADNGQTQKSTNHSGKAEFVL
jgi:hypothetical protein